MGMGIWLDFLVHQSKSFIYMVHIQLYFKNFTQLVLHSALLNSKYDLESEHSQ